MREVFDYVWLISSGFVLIAWGLFYVGCLIYLIYGYIRYGSIR